LAWKEYLGRTIGFAKVMAEAPFSDGTLAFEIFNFNLNERGFLESRFRIMPLIPSQWANADDRTFQEAGGISSRPAVGTDTFEHTTQPGESQVLAMKYWKRDGEIPEFVWITPNGFFRLIPGSRNGEATHLRSNDSPATASTSSPVRVGYGYVEEKIFEERDWVSYVSSVRPQSNFLYPPQMEVIGNRVYFTYCDGGQAYVWDGDRIRELGYSIIPTAPQSIGPGAGEEWVNDGGFSDGGRIGSLNHTLVGTPKGKDPAITTGGIESGLWYYAVVFENTDGAYSATSSAGGRVEIQHHAVAAGSPWAKYGIQFLCRRFWVNSIPKGPEGTVARILLRTMNLRSLPSGVTGRPRYLQRIANNLSTEYMDDIPDGELGPEWEDRRSCPRGVYFIKTFSASLFLMRTEDHPSRVWWSEQGGFNGSTPESFISTHWRDVFPETGAITGSKPSLLGDRKIMLVFKENATHYVSGDYPHWTFGTVSTVAGCAGPSLAQAAPDGTLIWYGSGTFWKLDTDGRAVDIGAPIRSKLKKINKDYERFGVSWTDVRTKEMVFALPYKTSKLSNFQFVWDYENNGWRLRSDIKIRCVETMDDKVIVSGTWKGRYSSKDELGVETKSDTMWIYGRGYPNFYPGKDLESRYTTGWMSFSEFGPSFHDTHRAAEAVFIMEERSGKLSSVKTYADWNKDSPVSKDLEIANVHPENDNIAVYDGFYGYNSSIDVSNVSLAGVQDGSSLVQEPSYPYRARRTYTQRLTLDVPSCTTFQLEVSASTIYSPVSLVSIDAYGPKTTLPGSRSPSIYEGE